MDSLVEHEVITIHADRRPVMKREYLVEWKVGGKSWLSIFKLNCGDLMLDYGARWERFNCLKLKQRGFRRLSTRKRLAKQGKTRRLAQMLVVGKRRLRQKKTNASLDCAVDTAIEVIPCEVTEFLR